MEENIAKQENVRTSCKICTFVILKGQENLLQKNLMKILGIGNAIVDVLCKVSDDFLAQNSLKKSTMKLVDETEFMKILSSLKIEETISGGSVANSVVGLSQLGNKVGFLGKINDDKLGRKYEEGLKKKMLIIYIKKMNQFLLVLV